MEPHTHSAAFTYFPYLCHPLGSVNAALLMSFLLFHENSHHIDLGVHKSANEIYQATGISCQAQRTARKILRDSGILIETHKRREYKIYYRIDRCALDTLLEGKIGSHHSCHEARYSGRGTLPENEPTPARKAPSATWGSAFSNAPPALGETLSAPVAPRTRQSTHTDLDLFSSSGVSPHTCVDWRAVLHQLSRAGYSTKKIEHLVGISHGTLMGWKNSDAQPSHPKGELLIAFWSHSLNLTRESLPMRQIALSRAMVG